MWMNPQQDHSPTSGDSGLVASAGGVYDKYGVRSSNPAIEPIVLSGVYMGEITYLGDETGDFVVDENGGRIIGGDASTMLRSKLMELRLKVRKKGKLWRVQLDSGRFEWKTARFLRMSQPQTVKDRLFKAHVTCTFESSMWAWRAASPTLITGAATPSAPGMLLAANPGEQVGDAVATITCTSGSITRVDFINSQLGVWWIWNWIGTPFTAGMSLVVDAGSQGVGLAGASDAYSGFQMVGTSPGWMIIPPGVWPFEVRVVGGNANVQLQFYAQYP